MDLMDLALVSMLLIMAGNLATATSGKQLSIIY